MAKCGSSDILSTIYKSIQQMAGKCRECVYKRFDELWRVFTDSVDCIVSEKPDPHMHSRSLVVKLSPTLVETFKCIFTGEVAKEYPTVISTKVQTSLLDLLKKAILLFPYYLSLVTHSHQQGGGRPRDFESD